MVSKSFKKKSFQFFALKNVNFNLEEGETVGLLGPNGAGKSTLFNLLSTFHTPSHGEIRSYGEKITPFSKIFKSTGLCPQDDILWSTFTVQQHIDIYQKLYQIPPSVSQQWLVAFELNYFKNNIPHELSTGMKRKLAFILACFSNPKNKFLDEPTSGVDPMTRKLF